MHQTPMPPIRTMAIVINPHKEGAEDLAASITREASKHGVCCSVFRDYPLQSGTLDGFQLCCVVGGDGTILGVVPEAVRTGAIILGVNLGKLGFLATYTPDEILSRIPSLVEGNYCNDERTLITCGPKDEVKQFALNDVVIKSPSVNLIALQVYQGDRRVADYSCDGLIFATPTGSTAYNLSAGGPILHPQNHSLAMTPICPHTLSNRSFIFPDTVTLRIECDCRNYRPIVSVDGRPWCPNFPLFPLHLAVASQRVTLIHDPIYSHYRTLRSKLNWV
jgi:NAD+ kinase